MLIETELFDISNTVEAMEPAPELYCCLLKQHEEQITGLKSEVADILHNIVTLNEDNTGVADRRFATSKAIFSTHLQIQRLLQAPSLASLQEAIKLLKIDVPTFKGEHHGVVDVLGAVKRFNPQQATALQPCQIGLPLAGSQRWHS